MKTNLKFIIIILFTVALTSCSPEDGKDGVDGEQGIQGEPGQDGNANVTSYLFENIPMEVGESDPFDIPAITQSIIDNGVVLGYVTGQNGIWFSLPYLEFDYEISISYIFEGGLITISNTALPSISYRFVVIEGSAGNRPINGEGMSAKEAIYEELKQAGVNINDYNAVAKYYNLPN